MLLIFMANIDMNYVQEKEDTMRQPSNGNNREQGSSKESGPFHTLGMSQPIKSTYFQYPRWTRDNRTGFNMINQDKMNIRMNKFMRVTG